jgi:hypothetical protein
MDDDLELRKMKHKIISKHLLQYSWIIMLISVSIEFFLTILNSLQDVINKTLTKYIINVIENDRV